MEKCESLMLLACWWSVVMLGLESEVTWVSERPARSLLWSLEERVPLYCSSKNIQSKAALLGYLILCNKNIAVNIYIRTKPSKLQ